MSQTNGHHRKRIIRGHYNINNDKDNNINNESFSTYNNEQQQQQQQQQRRHRIAYVRKKPDGLICSICDGPAHGYNFDAITCSCKAFFRRNALRSDVCVNN